ncbi:MAG TPA: hypothetical protein VK448_10210, partial [Dissulfurispiraceae bacterium]|nr:hypothetical protein [Dissulfurispiraceae bacterium]
VLTGCSIVFVLVYELLKIKFATDWDPQIFSALFPNQTGLLLPGYFGALIWLFIIGVRRIHYSGQYSRSLWVLSVFGRTSLFTYVVQFAVVESIPALLGYTGKLGVAGFLFLFTIGLIVIFVISFSYGRMRGWLKENDYIQSANIVTSGHSLYPK